MTKLEIKSARALAESIADELFRNGAGYEATRLILEIAGRNGGGWCKSAVIDRIVAIILEPIVQSCRKSNLAAASQETEGIKDV